MGMCHTTRIVTGCEEDAPGSLSFPDDMASCWRAEDAILADQELFHSICSADLGDQLCDLRVVESPVSSYHQERTLNTLRRHSHQYQQP